MLLYHKIEEVAAHPRNIRSGTVGWGFTMWSYNVDEDAPHRALLERFAAMYPEASISLPDYRQYEDYIEATAVWNGKSVLIYYETILSHLWLWSTDRTIVVSFRDALIPLMK